MNFFNRILLAVIVSVSAAQLTWTTETSAARAFQDFMEQYNNFSSEVPVSKTYTEAFARRIGLKKSLPERTEKFNALGIASFVDGSFIKLKDKPFADMYFSTNFYLDGDVKTQKLNLLYIYRDFYNKLMMPRGEEMLLRVLNGCFERVDARATQRISSRDFMHTLVGKPASTLLTDDTSIAGLDKMRLELLQKYFNTELVQDLVQYLESEKAKNVEELGRIVRRSEETTKDFEARKAGIATKAKKNLIEIIKNKLKALQGVNVGLTEGQDEYTTSERGFFTILELESLKREMEAIESIPFSYITKLKHTTQVAIAAASTAAVGYGAYHYYQGNLDPAIDMTKKFVMETLPAAFAISNIKDRAFSLFNAGVAFFMPLY